MPVVEGTGAPGPQGPTRPAALGAGAAPSPDAVTEDAGRGEGSAPGARPCPGGLRPARVGSPAFRSSPGAQGVLVASAAGISTPETPPPPPARDIVTACHCFRLSTLAVRAIRKALGTIAWSCQPPRRLGHSEPQFAHLSNGRGGGMRQTCLCESWSVRVPPPQCVPVVGSERRAGPLWGLPGP